LRLFTFTTNDTNLLYLNGIFQRLHKDSIIVFLLFVNCDEVFSAFKSAESVRISCIASDIFVSDTLA
jgi:hypothetical protein